MRVLVLRLRHVPVHRAARRDVLVYRSLVPRRHLRVPVHSVPFRLRVVALLLLDRGLQARLPASRFCVLLGNLREWDSTSRGSLKWKNRKSSLLKPQFYEGLLSRTEWIFLLTKENIGRVRFRRAAGWRRSGATSLLAWLNIVLSGQIQPLGLTQLTAKRQRNTANLLGFPHRQGGVRLFDASVQILTPNGEHQNMVQSVSAVARFMPRHLCENPLSCK